MKKTIAVIGSAAALSFAGAGLAAAQDVDTLDDDTGAPQGVQVETTQNDDEPGDGENGNDDQVDTPEEVSDIAMQLCGTISAYDFLGSAGSFLPGLEGEECEANADAAVEAAMSGDIGGALDILRGIEAELPDGDDAVDTGSAGLLDGFDSLSGAPEGDAEPAA
ncbi:hypothetical protein [uncultured Dietzia sp.]|uniref:hypothetical protein n=1 Tax=uncultured Dietzia sp. TaxID=395519 RepID=UPI0025F4466A|nr:hypothetical protein [uncultured Dietzia sp.]